MTPEYIQLLPTAERAEIIKFGMAVGLARHGIRPRSLEKQAGGLGSGLDVAGKSILTLSLLGGIPLGAAAHIIGQASKHKSRKAEEAEQRIKYYQNASRQLETGLADNNLLSS